MADQLQLEAEELINALKLDYSNLGEFHLVGNAALGTTVKPDIDYQLYPNDLIYQEVAEKIQLDLAQKGLIQTVIRDLKQSNKYLVTGNFNYKGRLWTIDISITEPQEEYIDDAYEFLKNYYDKINDNNRPVIIRLKQFFLKKDMLWNGMSYYIYRTVLDNGGKTARDVFDYLKEKNINISRFKKKGNKG
jgi:hypothetical protein